MMCHYIRRQENQVICACCPRRGNIVANALEIRIWAAGDKVAIAIGESIALGDRSGQLRNRHPKEKWYAIASPAALVAQLT